MLRWVFAYLCSLLAGCGDDLCVRQSDCPAGLTCVAGECVAGASSDYDLGADSMAVPSDAAGELTLHDGGTDAAWPEDASLEDVSQNDALSDGFAADTIADVDLTDAEADGLLDGGTDA